MTPRGARARSARPLLLRPRSEEARVPGQMSRPTVPSRAGEQGCGMHPSGSDQTGSGAATRRGA
eukprot:6850823-Pyramimonas_sp.AAC.1